MNVRAFLIVPAVLAVGVLAGCGQTGDGASGDGQGSGSARVRIPSSEVCNSAAWIRERAPEGLCTTTETVDDYLSPLRPRVLPGPGS